MNDNCDVVDEVLEVLSSTIAPTGILLVGIGTRHAVLEAVNLGQGKLDLNVDLYNAFNSDAILTQQNAYGATWQNALTVVQPRFVKFSARWDF